MPEMRAKMAIYSVVVGDDGSEQLSMRAVCRNDAYPEDGSDENNTFAQFTPAADLTMVVNNPALAGKFKEGDAFYLDFTKA
ncbi:hypothetical protein [Marinobacterium lutimaris]|uniref:Uncharacterized protein n=1 Tax=Marinobacterium lutimaris TaxID=568106 RepID=A0A1H5XNY8_9GAMM|nr:hypothetical protein [Marinobacterium lutimaris]SEG13157.1 hypothetical protein SAMN05444390_1011444 [Marinobacterium lutimaris]